MSNVFISYARADRQNVERLVRALRAANIVGWLDATDLAAGANISSEIQRFLHALRIRTCHLHEAVTMPQQGAKCADLLRWPERSLQQAH